MSKLTIISEFWQFLKVRKKWWLLPIILALLLLGVLIVFSEGSALAPFIYTLFWYARRIYYSHCQDITASSIWRIMIKLLDSRRNEASKRKTIPHTKMCSARMRGGRQVSLSSRGVRGTASLRVRRRYMPITSRVHTIWMAESSPARGKFNICIVWI